MFKSTSFPFTIPVLKSSNRSSNNMSAVSWKSQQAPQARVQRSNNNLAKFSLVIIVVLGVMMALHLYWVNTYAAKGFALSAVQKSIAEQTDLQKKLLVQQSLLNSTAGLTDYSRTGLVAITEEEYLVNPNFASAQ
ncbi:MAG TPA: hypothetical protein PKD79_00410 [Candidatus Doudnabacteria bacterium]|nr:hypothetical protein [Candidatus Doudnabacteria bacterium]